MNDDPKMPEPAAYVDDLSRPQPHCVTSLKYCSVLQHQRGDHLRYIPLITTAAAQAYAEAMAAARVAQERERCAAAVRAGHDSGDATGMDREVYMWNKAVAHCLRRVLMPESFTPIDQPPETGKEK